MQLLLPLSPRTMPSGDGAHVMRGGQGKLRLQLTMRAVRRTFSVRITHTISSGPDRRAPCGSKARDGMDRLLDRVVGLPCHRGCSFGASTAVNCFSKTM